MKVTCEYCGSYVEADDNMKCPCCFAGLGSAVQAEQQRIAEAEQAEQQRVAEAELAEQQREAKAKEQEAKENHVSEIIKGVASVATAFVAGKAASSESEAAHPHQHVEDRPPAEGKHPFRERPRAYPDAGHDRRPAMGGPGGGGASRHPGGPRR